MPCICSLVKVSSGSVPLLGGEVPAQGAYGDEGEGGAYEGEGVPQHVPQGP